MSNAEIVLFVTKDDEITLNVPIENDTVWLSQAQMTELFGRDVSVISRHISKIFSEGEVEKESNLHFLQIANADRPVAFYSLDVIISVGYRIKSRRGVEFRRWATNILKQYILKGYAINEKRLHALNKTVDIQSRMLADALNIEEKDILRAVNEYTDALLLLDQYDHQALVKPQGNTPVYRITYDECVAMVQNPDFWNALFGNNGTRYPLLWNRFYLHFI